MKHIMRLAHGALLVATGSAFLLALAISGWILAQVPVAIPVVLLALVISYCAGWALDDE